MLYERLTAVCSHKFPKRLTLFYFEKVLVVIRVSLVVETKVARTILAQKQFLSSADLIVKLGKGLKMREGFWDFVTLDWFVSVTAKR